MERLVKFLYAKLEELKNNEYKEYVEDYTWGCIDMISETLGKIHEIENPEMYDIDYKSMWLELKEQTNKDLECHKSGVMQSVSESIQGEIKCKEFIAKMEKIEEEYQ